MQKIVFQLGFHKSLNSVTIFDLVTVYLKTKSVSKSRVHFMYIHSSNITPAAGTVLGKVQGGNTETAIKPAGTRAKEANRVRLGLVGSPPPPGSPG